MPQLAALVAEGAATSLVASGPRVGLPEGHASHGEVAWSVLGSGRVAKPAVALLDELVSSRRLALDAAIEFALVAPGNLSTPSTDPEAHEKQQVRLHVITLLSDARIHASDKALDALLELAEVYGVRVVVHAILDGRDGRRRDASERLLALEERLGKTATLGTVAGRAWAMDTGHDWERTRAYYAAVVRGDAPTKATWFDVLEEAYGEGLGDAEVRPCRIGTYEGLRGSLMADFGALEPEWLWLGGEIVLLAHARAEGLAQLAAMLRRRGLPEDVADFLTERSRRVVAQDDGYLVSLGALDAELGARETLSRPAVEGTLVELVSRAGLSQLHVVARDRASALGYFGGLGPLAGLSQTIVPAPSPELPTLALERARDRALDALERGVADLVVVGLAEADRAGHAGDLDVVPAALRALDDTIARLARAALARGGTFVLVGSWGNVEQVLGDDDDLHTGHTTSPVPFVVVGASARGLRAGGSLVDVAPTVLELLGLPAPSEMTGRSLVEPSGGEAAST
jgi:2,3-bisphosphoglycerate-independent phosphoglycerate mutase